MAVIITAIGALLIVVFLYNARTVEITRTVTVTRTVTATPKPSVIIKHRTKTVTVPDPAETACIANLWHSYIALANGGPAGDPSLFIVDCPGVHINGLSR
jgi:hypothetical protein